MHWHTLGRNCLNAIDYMSYAVDTCMLLYEYNTCLSCIYIIYIYIFIKGSLDEKLPIYEQDPKSKRLDSEEIRFV